MKILKIILKLILFIIFIILMITLIDYTRVNTGEEPLFNTKKYNDKTKVYEYKSILYVSSRRTIIDKNEPFNKSKDISFKIFNYSLPVPNDYKKGDSSISMEVKKSDTCTNSNLVYADENIKVYTYCLDSISVKDIFGKLSLEEYLLKNKNQVMNEIEYNLKLKNQNNNILKFTSTNNKFSNEKLTLYKCINNDYYLTSNKTDIQKDFCFNKNDDFKYLFEIEEEQVENTTQVVEEFYKDEEYIYSFSTPRKDHINLVRKENRGRPEVKISLVNALNSNLVTIDDLSNKGLKFNKTKINK